MPHRRKSSAGSFNDEFGRLLERLASAPLAELGKPLGSEIAVPIVKRQPRIGRCSESHNRYLLDAHAWSDKAR